MICSMTLRASEIGIAKTDAERAAGTRIDGGVDADQVAVAVDQSTTRIARVDRGIGLNEVLEGVDAEMRPPEGRDDSHRHRLADTKRIADRQRDVADGDVVHPAECDCRQGECLAVPRADLQDRQVGLRIAANQAGVKAAPVAEGDLDLIGTLHDMEIREKHSHSN
jgi:hypothetical protein